MEQLPCNYRISIKALIRQDKNILLIQGGEGWELPGGGLEHGEPVEIALEREIDEELGQQVYDISHQPVDFWTIEKQVGPNLKWFGIVLYETKTKGDFKSSNEAVEIGYFSPEEIRNLDLHPNTQPYFNK